MINFINDYNVDPWLYKFAEEIIFKYDYDESHDMRHFLNVVNYAKDIIKNDYLDAQIILDLPNRESIKIILDASFCHDLIDSKYVNSIEMLDKLKTLCLHNDYKYFNILSYLIENISFSKQRKVDFKPIEKYYIALMIVSDADKLDAYRIERIIAYQNNKYKDLPNDIKKMRTKIWLKTILVKRVLEYKDKWLKTDYAKKIAVPMHENIVKYVKEHLLDIEMADY